MLLDNEQAVELKQGLIQLSTAVRHPGKITISTDNTPAFVALYKRTEKKQLNDLEIKIKPKDEFNKNENAAVDKVCQELENEIRKIRPEGGKIN